EPGAVGDPVPLSTCAGARAWLAGERRAREPPATHARGALARGGRARARSIARYAVADRELALWRRPAGPGVPPAAREGRRFLLPADPRARRQGRQGSRHDAAREAGRTAARSPGARARAACAGPRRRLRRGRAAVCARAKVSARRERVGVAVHLSVDA